MGDRSCTLGDFVIECRLAVVGRELLFVGLPGGRVVPSIPKIPYHADEDKNPEYDSSENLQSILYL